MLFSLSFKKQKSKSKAIFYVLLKHEHEMKK